ncbi:cobyrinate a,c-diamide synthase [Gottschalkiaceae bacterium SANA]|nr:cobyrinate a,c-diamide synthase [Gottschalkiaceae bacterium SANA]
MKGFVLAGTHSGVGKTTLSLGLMRAYRNRGMQVAPFKVGPDYIDPMFHRIAAGNISYNLDLILMKKDGVKRSFVDHAGQSDIAIVEGVMGLYDGMNFSKDNGSTAHVARVLDLPVFLVVDAQGMAASVLAHIQGYCSYDPNLRIAGIILNRVSSEGLYKYLKEPIEEHLGIPCVGYLPKDKQVHLSSRHLGLIPVNELDHFDEKLNRIADLVEEHFDWELIQEISEIQIGRNETKADHAWAKGLRIGIAHDDAFNFYYQENLERVEKWGGEWISCSPMKDSKLPEGIDALYLGGGFPEVFAKELNENQGFVQDLKEKIAEGLPVYAECGGYLYLSSSIQQLDGSLVPMTGILSGKGEMTKRLQRFGYVSCQWGELEIRAHEFHRSRIIHLEPVQQVLQLTQLRNQEKHWKCGERFHNVLAGYPHLHFTGNPEFLKKMIGIVQKRKKENGHVRKES